MMPEQPDHLILKFLSGAATAEEQQQLEAWTSSSAENKKTLQDFQKIWNDKGILSQPDFNSHDEWLKLKNQMELEKDNVRVLSHASGLAFRIAASVLMVAVSGIFVYVMWFRTEILVEQTADHTREVKLPDGSVVWLNKNSEVSYSSDFSNERNITLTGEAFFDVEPEPEKPFIISTGEAEVKVLGTSFNVRAYKNDSEQQVYVATGKVNVRSKKGNVDLIPGDIAVLHKNDLSLESSHTDDPNALAWKSRQLVFNKTNLKEVASTLEHYFHVSITIKNPVLEKCRFTSSFNNPTLEEVIEAISLSLSLNVVHQNEDYTWDGEGCAKEEP